MNLLIRFLAFIGLKNAMTAYVLSHQSPKTYKDNMEYAFSDSQNRRYFYFPDLKKMPLVLHEKLNELLAQMEAKVPGKDMDRWIEKVEGVLNDEKKKNKITEVGYWLGILKENRSITFHPTILTEIVALLYIREDENPCNYNAALHKEKFDTIWADSKEGALLYDFFQQGGLRAYIPSHVTTKEDWAKYLVETLEKTKRFNMLLSETSTLLSA